MRVGLDRYHFDIADRGQIIADDEGQEYPDLATAILEARRAFDDLDAETPDLSIHLRVDGVVVAIVHGNGTDGGQIAQRDEVHHR